MSEQSSSVGVSGPRETNDSEVDAGLIGAGLTLEGIADTHETQFDTAVVLVHGIGRQLRSETLLEWCEPLTRRLDYLMRHSGGATQITDSRIAGSTRDEARVVVRLDQPSGTRDIIFTEARWADSFLPPSAKSLPGWVVRNGFRAALRLAMLLLRNSLGTWRSMGRELVRPVAVPFVAFGRTRGVEDAAPRIMAVRPYSIFRLYAEMIFIYAGALFALVMSLVGAVALVIVGWILPAIAVLLTFLLVVLVRIPGLSRWLRGAVLLLTDFIGDAAVWTDQPVRAEAMMNCVRDEVRHANRCAKRTIVIAHSQGAAISARALLGSIDIRVDHLVTVGGAVDLLAGVGWQGSQEVTPDPVVAWQRRSATRWTNIWAGFDPVPAGPISPRGLKGFRRSTARWNAVDACSQRLSIAWLKVANQEFGIDPSKLRFMETYAALSMSFAHAQVRKTAKRSVAKQLKAGQKTIDRLLPDARIEMIKKYKLQPGPEERRVQNLGSVISDHIAYAKNIAQVIDPIARSVILEDETGRVTEARRLSNDHARAVRLLVLLRLLAFIASVASAPLIIAWIPWLATPDDMKDITSGSAVWSFIVATLESSSLWPLVTLSAVSLVLYAILAGLVGGVWNIWVNDIAWKRDRKHPLFGLLKVLPFALVFLFVAPPGTFLGLRAAINIYNDWFRQIPVFSWAPQVDASTIALIVISVIVLVVMLIGALLGGEYATLPEIRATVGQTETIRVSPPAGPTEDAVSRSD
ncbi:hypothetical protein [Microbacterium lacus]|uniref:Alpha/beta hydrolase n=1 Tax=Microbacterium lacus TaxID=415217 RepID=A0ABN2FXW4_9MICO